MEINIDLQPTGWEALQHTLYYVIFDVKRLCSWAQTKHTHSHAQSVTFNSPAITANPHIHIRENRKYMKVNTEINFSDLHSNDLNLPHYNLNIPHSTTQMHFKNKKYTTTSVLSYFNYPLIHFRQIFQSLIHWVTNILWVCEICDISACP